MERWSHARCPVGFIGVGIYWFSVAGGMVSVISRMECAFGELVRVLGFDGKRLWIEYETEEDIVGFVGRLLSGQVAVHVVDGRVSRRCAKHPLLLEGKSPSGFEMSGIFIQLLDGRGFSTALLRSFESGLFECLTCRWRHMWTSSRRVGAPFERFLYAWNGVRSGRDGTVQICDIVDGKVGVVRLVPLKIRKEMGAWRVLVEDGAEWKDAVNVAREREDAVVMFSLFW